MDSLWVTTKQVSAAFLKSVSTFSLMVVGGIFLFLVITTAWGYLPYSDRPGPGFYGHRGIGWDEILFFAGWAIPILGPSVAIAGILLFGLARGLRLLRAPRWLIGLICAPCGGLVALVLALAAG